MSLLDYQYPPHVQPIVDEMRRKAAEYAMTHPRPEPPNKDWLFGRIVVGKGANRKFVLPGEVGTHSQVFVRENPETIGWLYVFLTLEEEAALLRIMRSNPATFDETAWRRWLAKGEEDEQRLGGKWKGVWEAPLPDVADPVHQERLSNVEVLRERLSQATQWRDDLIMKLREELSETEFNPKNEMEVIMLFSKIDTALGMRPVRLKVNTYPDGIYEMNGEWTFVEFEYRSSNFVTHGHQAERTDLVICWIHDRPLPVPVMELQHAYNATNLTFNLAAVTVV